METQSLASIPLKKPAFDDGWNHSLDDCVDERLLSDAQVGAAGLLLVWGLVAAV